jgi:hypothetical protein
MVSAAVSSRLRFRRLAASASLICGIIVPTLIVIAGMFSDMLAGRLATMSVVVMALFGQAVGIVGWYFKVGSDETQMEMTK